MLYLACGLLWIYTSPVFACSEEWFHILFFRVYTICITSNNYTFVQCLEIIILQAKNVEFRLDCVCVFNLIFIFLSQCYSLTTHESGDGRTAGGVSVKTIVTINWQLIPLPLPLLYLSPPSSCLIMLLCVCLSVCILCVKGCVFLRSLCQCVCSSNTGFSPHYPHLLPSSSLLTFDGYTPHLLSILFSIIFWILTLFNSPPVPFLTNSSPLPSICPFIDPSIHSPPLVSSSQLPSSTPLYFSFTSHLWSLALPFLFLPHPVHFVLLLPSSLPLSLSHSALCLALSGWAAPRWLRVCVHSGACRASPPPGLTTRFCLSPLNSAAPPPLPSLPPLPFLHPSLFFAHSTRLLIPPWCRQQHPLTPSPSYLLTFRCPFLPVGSTLLSGSSLVRPQTLFVSYRIAAL